MNLLVHMIGLAYSFAHIDEVSCNFSTRMEKFFSVNFEIFSEIL